MEPPPMNRQTDMTENITLLQTTYVDRNNFGNKNAFQLNANHPLADSMGYIKLEGKKIFLL